MERKNASSAKTVVFGMVILVAIFLMLSVIADYLLLGKTPAHWFAPSPAQLKVRGSKIIDQLEEYRKRTGVYPKTLIDAKIDAQETVLGPFNYELHDGGRVFKLSVGSLKRDGFELTYTSNEGWHFDS